MIEFIPGELCGQDLSMFFPAVSLEQSLHRLPSRFSESFLLIGAPRSSAWRIQPDLVNVTLAFYLSQALDTLPGSDTQLQIFLSAHYSSKEPFLNVGFQMGDCLSARDGLITSRVTL